MRFLKSGTGGQAMTLSFTARIVTGDLLLDTDLRDLQCLSGPGGTFLYAATGQNGGLTAWSVGASASQPAALSDSVYFTATGVGMGGLVAVSLGGAPALALTGTTGTGLVHYRPNGAGGLSASAAVALPGGGYGALAQVALSGGKSGLYAADPQTGRLTGWIMEGSGALTGPVALNGGDAAYDLAGIVALRTVETTEGPFLLMADAAGVRSYDIGPASGRLKPAGQFGAANGLGISAPSALETVSAFGKQWALLAAAGSNSVSVLRLGADGALIYADHVLDTLATRFGGATALKVLKVQGRVLVLAGGADDGMTLFELIPTGQLVHVQSLAHDTGLGLEDITAIEATETDTDIAVFVTSAAAGLSQFSLKSGGLSAPLRPVADSDAPVKGAGGDDLIVGRKLAVSLSGRQGDDILVAGSGGGVLKGGAGRDIFVPHPGAAVVKIADFTPGEDRLDLSAFAMMRSPGQVRIRETDSGAVLTIGDSKIRVTSAAEHGLSAADLWPQGFETPDRVPVPDGPVIVQSFGTAQGETLTGSAVFDIIRARAGDDRLMGRKGQDRLTGERGDDVALGGTGADRLIGGPGNDTLRGGKQGDRLTGGGDNDRLAGGAGADVFIFHNGHGRDRITDFDPARDLIRLDTGQTRFRQLEIGNRDGDALIDTGTGTIRLIDIKPGALDGDHFVFG